MIIGNSEHYSLMNCCYKNSIPINDILIDTRYIHTTHTEVILDTSTPIELGRPLRHDHVHITYKSFTKH